MKNVKNFCSRLPVFLILVALLLQFFSCSPEPTVDLPIASFNFTALNNDLRAPAEITFVPSETNPNASFSWDFGDGTSSTEKSPKKVFTTGGSKLVTLKTSFSATSTSSTETKTIAIDKPYTKFYITKSTILTAATAFPNGTGWDIVTTGSDIYLMGGADVYLIAKFDNLSTESYYTAIKPNVTATQLTNGSLFWEHASAGFLVNSAAATAANLRIELRDADVSSTFWGSLHEGMGYTDLKLSDLMQISNKYPKSIELKGTASTNATQKYLNDALKIRLDLNWAE
jgi:PKD repeat protein